MKKIIALLTAFALLIGVCQIPGGVIAEEKSAITLKQAIEIAKTTLGIKTEGFEFNSSYFENQNGFNVWSLNWNNNKITNESILVSVDAKEGKIVSLGWYTPYEQPKSKIPKHTKAEALKVAETWVTKLQPERLKLTRLKDNTNQDYYNKYSDVFTFEYVRMQDGIEVTPNNITVQIDKNTLKIRGFHMIWDNQSLPSKSNAFNLDKAKELFKSKLGLELTYNLIYNDSKNGPKAILAYSLKNGNQPIDAINGELITNAYRIYYTAKEASADQAPSPTNQVVITPEEQSELEKNNKYITKSAAEEVIRQYIKIDDDMKLERANLYPSYDKINATWTLEWKYSNPEDKTNKYKYISAQVDAVTKEFKSFNISTRNESQSNELTAIEKEKAKKLAEEFLAKVQPEKFKNTQYKEYKDIHGYSYSSILPPYDLGYGFNYIRVENGVPCPSNSLFVRVNQYTGEIVSYNTNWQEISFPSPDKVITLDKAYEIMFNKIKFGMQYIYHYPSINDYDKKEIKLAYVLDNQSILMDANSGQMLNYDGTPVKSTEKLTFTDIKGNKAEEEINILIDMGILVPENTKYAPESKMLQKDFIKLLMNSLQPEYYPMPITKDQNPYDNYYNEAIRRKLITAAEKKPEAAVTRQDAARMIIRAMNYGVIAEKGKMFAASFKDSKKLTPAYKGYAVIAAELGIITPIKNYFYPTNTITRGDAAEILVNYLKCETSL